MDMWRDGTTRGLSNSSGENNCFLNVLIQVLYHLEDFRVMFESITWVDPGPQSPFAALKALFQRLGTKGGGALAPDQLRSALAKAYRQEGKFQLNEMDDATETLEKLLAQLNFNVNGDRGKVGRQKASMLTFPYHIFSTEVVHHGVCNCGIASTATSTTSNVLHASVDALKDSAGRHGRSKFGTTLRHAVFANNMVDCKVPGCLSSTQAVCSLKHAPAVLAVSLNWSSASPAPAELKAALKVIKTDLDLRDTFQNLDKPYGYSLASVVCYYGQHYAAFVRDLRTKKWTYYDDSLVKNVGTTWDEVLTRCEAGRWQPQLLMYSRLGDSFQPPSSSCPAVEVDGSEWRASVFGRQLGQASENYAAVQLPDGPATTPFPVYDTPLTYGISHLSVADDQPYATAGAVEYSVEAARAAMMSPYEYTYGDEAFRHSALGRPGVAGAQSTVSYGEPADSMSRGIPGDEGQLRYGIPPSGEQVLLVSPQPTGEASPARWMADGASSAQSGASSASSAQTNSTGVTYSLASLAPPTPEQPSYLDKIDNFVRSAQMYEHLTNYASARQCYEAAADTMMDMLEAPDYWPPGSHGETRRKAIATAARYLEVAEAMNRQALIY